MKQLLRVLCVVFVTTWMPIASFAQENVTSHLRNADMEQGIAGWNLESDSHIWKENTKDQASRPGFHGVSNVVLENWKSDATSGLSNNTISQTVKNLPNGTYVFGAYIGASVQAQEDNRESVTGVTLFANEATTAVATNNPDLNQKWAHTAKFNVAVNVTDGTLNVGLQADATNANYLVWDNVTLYYFGDMDAAAALDEMAKIDMAATVAIADTCVAYKMNVDTAAYLNEQIVAGRALTGAADAYQTDENVYWAIRLANKSIADYRGLNNAIVAAKEIAAMEWSSAMDAAVKKLNGLVAEAEGMYEAAAANREKIAAEKIALAEATAYVELDSCYIKIDFVYEWLDTTEPGEELGQYTDEMLTRVQELLEEVGVVLEESENGLSAVTAKHRCDSLYALIADVQANPLAFDEFPIVIERGEETYGGYKFMEGTTTDEAGVVTYTSKLYRFPYPLTKVRFIVHETGSNNLNSGYPFFTMQRFEMFDEDGNEIELTEKDITSNACHNTLNPGAHDGAGILGLVDDDPNTFFHSTWNVAVNEPHYLEVTLPDGEYSAFSFSMTGRGANFTHQFPAVLEITHVSEAASKPQYTKGDKIVYVTPDGIENTYTIVGDNLIINPSFDNGTEGWTGGSGGALTNTEVNNIGGVDGGAYIRPTSNSGKGDNNSIGTAWEVEVGKTYVFSFFLKNHSNTAAESPAGNGYIKVSMGDTPREETYVLEPLPHVDADLAWTQNTYVFTADYSYISLCARWLGGSKCFDEFILAEVVAGELSIESILSELQDVRGAVVDYLSVLDSLNLIGMKTVLADEYEKTLSIDETNVESISAETERLEELLLANQTGVEAYLNLGNEIAKCDSLIVTGDSEDFSMAIDSARNVYGNTTVAQGDDYVVALQRLIAARSLYQRELLLVESPWEGTIIESGKSYYIYNIKAKAFLTGGNAWGTQASLLQDGTPFLIVGADGIYTLKSVFRNGQESSSYLAYNGYCDGEANNFALTLNDGGLYTIGWGDSYFAYDETSTVVTTVNELTDECYWQFLTVEDILAGMSHATLDNPIDVTSLLSCANFGRNNTDVSKWIGSPSIGGENSNYCAEKWNAGIITVSQVLMDMPSGLYRLEAQGFYRMGSMESAAMARTNGTEVSHAKFFANGDSVAVMSVLEEAGKLAGVGNSGYTGYGLAPNSMVEASQFFNAGYYEHTLDFALYEGQNTINLGVTKTGYVNADWLIFDNFRLTYYGVEGLEDLESSRLEKYLTIMESLMNTADSLDASSATLAAQEELTAAIAACDSVLLAPSVEALTTTIAQLEGAIVRVERSILINAEVNDTSIDIPVDFTQFVVNHDMSEGINGWETTPGWQYQQSTDYVNAEAVLSKFQEIWSGSSLGLTSSKQTMIDMPNGIYCVSADIVATSQYSGDQKNDVVEAYWVANENRVSVSTYNGIPENFSVETEVMDGVLSFGLVGENTTANWLAFDNVKVVSIEREGTLEDWLVRLENTRETFAEYILMLDSMNLIGVKDGLVAKYEEVVSVDETSKEQVRTEIRRINCLFTEYEEALEAYHTLGALIAECEEYTSYSPVEELFAAIEIAKATFVNSSATVEEFLDAYATLYEARRMYAGFARVHVDVQGTLAEKILSQVASFDSVERLEVSGKLNDEDLSCIHYDLTALKHIDMAGAEVTHLHDWQFEYHYQLKSVTLPATLTTIGNNIFEGCDSLESVISPALIPPYVNNKSFGMRVSNGQVKLYVPEWTINWYKLDEVWDDFAVIKPIEGYWPEHIGVAQDLTLTLPETLPIAYKPSLSIDWSNALNRQSALTIDGNDSLALKEFSLGYDVEWEARCNGAYITHATLINNATISADSISMWVEIRNDQWSFLSFPFDVKVADIMPTQPNTSYVIRRYSGEERAKLNYSNTWQDMTVDSILHAGEGYIWQSSRPGYSASAFMVSAANTENKNNIFAHTDCVVALNKYIAVNSNNSSWNLIGNPYPSYYDSREMDFTAPITVWNMYHGSYFAYSPVDDEYILRPSEAFFVQCPEDVEAITFRADGRQSNRVVRNRVTETRANARNTNKRQVFNLTLSCGEKNDRTRFVINSDAACDYEMATDANKFMSCDARAPQLYTIEGGVKYAINERPMGNGTIMLGTYFGSNDSYTIALDAKVEGMNVVLVDKVMGVETDLMCESYTFHAEAGTADSRFHVCLRVDEESGDQTGLESLVGKVDITSAARTITVKAPCESLIEIYDAEGRCIATTKATMATFDLEAGVYVVRVQDAMYKVIVK